MSGPQELSRAVTWALIEVQARRDLRRRLFPAGAACACGVNDPLLLVIGRRPWVCYRCRLLARGKLAFEEHHIGGKQSSVLVLLDANRHRLHDAYYQDALERLDLPFEQRLLVELVLFPFVEQLLDDLGQGRKR